jgi:putative ATP-binding cassette transporter
MATNERGGWTRFVELVQPFLQSDRRTRAWLMLGALVGLLFLLSALNVVASYVNRDVMTALEQRQSSLFARRAALWLGLFAVLTTVAVTYRYTEERLALYWREWMTRRFYSKYLDGRRHYLVDGSKGIDNPDQRISEDIRTFTVNTLSVLLILLNSTISFVAFIGVLWAITPWLVLAAIVYAGFGTGMAMLVGKRLVPLDNRQYAAEADFRIELARVRDHSASLAALGNSEGVSQLLRHRFGMVVGNLKKIISVNRDLGFFTHSFGYLTPVLPVLIVAPTFFRGEVEFGVVTQSAIAFAQVLGSISLAITNFGQIAALAAVVHRLGRLRETLEEAYAPPSDAPKIVEVADRWGCEGVTLVVAGSHRAPLENLTFENREGRTMLVLGSKGVGKTELFNATAGLRTRGSGIVTRPSDAVFVPMRPYYPPGTLWELLTDFGIREVEGKRVCEILSRLGYSPAVEGLSSLEEFGDWSERSAPHDLNAIAVTRLLLQKPQWAFLNGVANAFGASQRREVYSLLSEAGITYVSFSDDADFVPFHDRILHLEGGGKWRIEELR